LATQLISLRDYLRLVFRRKTVLVLPFVASIIAIAPALMFVPTKYQAVAQVMRQDLGIARRAGTSAGSSSARSLDTLRVQIMTSNNLRRVLIELRMDAKLKSARDWQRAVSDLHNSITIRMRARSQGIDIIEISAVHEQAELSANIANGIAQNYVEESTQANRLRPSKAIDYLGNKVTSSLSLLQRAEDQIQDYRENHLRDLPEQRLRIITMIEQLELDRESRAILILELTKELEGLSKELKETPQTVTREITTQPNPEHVSLSEKVSNLKLALDELLINLTREHPTVVSTVERIKRLELLLKETDKTVQGTEVIERNPIYVALVSRFSQAQTKILTTKAALQGLNARLTALNDRATKVRKESKKWEDRMREVANHAREYERYSEELRKAELELDVESSQFGTQVDMLQPAFPPADPYRAPHLKLALACIAGGLAMGVGLMFALEWCDNSLNSIEDAANFLGMPVLGCISTITSPEARIRRRNRRILIAVLIVALILLAAGGLALYNYNYPGSLGEIYNKVRGYTK
jgi:protein tyrosine kinase modulator